MAWTKILGSNISTTTKLILSNLNFYSPSGIFGLPFGTTAQRPTVPLPATIPYGTIRYNITKDSAEIYNTQTGVPDWNGIGSETGVDGGDVIIRTNGTTITKDITIGPTANNDQKYTYGLLMGDITIANDVTVDIEPGAGLLIYDEPYSYIPDPAPAVQLLDGSTEENAAPSPSHLRELGITTNDVYWLKPEGDFAPYRCYVEFGVYNLDWATVCGMDSGGIRADANGNGSGLAGFSLLGENTAAATLNGNSVTNSSNVDFCLPRDWINACNPVGLKIRSSAEYNVALFNRSGILSSRSDIWGYYWAINNFNNIPTANGRTQSSSTVSSWIGSNVNIYWDVNSAGTSGSGPESAILWSGNHHCGWSTSGSHHMLHGSTNFSYGSNPYNGFCIDNTCWNQSAIVSIAF